MKQFFTKMEEKFVFPIGRRTWQILAFLSLIALGAFITWFLINSMPTSREKVIIEKDEVVNNKIDTTSKVKVEEENPECLISEYNIYLDSLKRDLPKAEWKDLGSYSEPYEEYEVDQYGYYVYDENGNVKTVEKRDYIKNYEAIPNRLEDLYLAQGIDSLEVCEKIEVLKTFHYLSKITSPQYFQDTGFDDYYDVLYNVSKVNLSLLQNTTSFVNKINNDKLLIENKDDFESYFKYVGLFSTKNVSEDQIRLCENFLEDHKKLSSPQFKKNKYFDLVQIIVQSEMPIKELETALIKFREDIKFYDKHELDTSLNRYLSLYAEKLNLAEVKKQEEDIKKTANKSFSLMAIGAAFLSVLSIATILLLYSIQQLLKNHTEKKQ